MCNYTRLTPRSYTQTHDSCASQPCLSRGIACIKISVCVFMLSWSKREKLTPSGMSLFPMSKSLAIRQQFFIASATSANLRLRVVCWKTIQGPQVTVSLPIRKIRLCLHLAIEWDLFLLIPKYSSTSQAVKGKPMIAEIVVAVTSGVLTTVTTHPLPAGTSRAA